MASYQNTRRSAAGANGTVSYNYESPTSGSNTRKKMIEDGEIMDVDKILLNLAMTPGNITESDIAMVLKLDATDVDKTCIETDSPPKLVATDICEYSNVNIQTDFFLLCPIIENKKWADTLPRYLNWLTSRCRYPTIKDTKSITPSAGNTGVSEIDIYETYAAVLSATIFKFYTTSKESYLKPIWFLLRIMKNFSSSRKYVTNTDVNALETFKDLIRKRDSDHYIARKYKTFLKTLSPTDFYTYLYTLALTEPDCVHKSCMTHLDLFLLGLFSQISQQKPIIYSGICDIFLRMVLERSMRRTEKLNLSDFTDRDELVKYVLINAGKHIESSLRYWTFIQMAVFQIGEGCSFHDFCHRMVELHKHIKTINGLLPFCLLLSPDSERYINEEILAEFIITASEDAQKNTLLGSSMFVTAMKGTPRINRILANNIQRIQKLKNDLSTAAGSNEGNAWENFAKQIKFTHNNPQTSVLFKQAIIGYAQNNDMKSIRELMEGQPRYTSNTAANREKREYPILSDRRILNLVLRVIPDDSPIFADVSRGRSKTDIQVVRHCIPQSKKYQILRDVLGILHIQNTQNIEGDTNDYSVEDHMGHQMEFINFEHAKLISRDAEEFIRAILTDYSECPICYQKTNRYIKLHNEPRHVVCESCRKKIKECPFCRETNI